MNSAAPQSFELTTRRTRDGLAYIVSVVGGPQDIIKRTTEAAALEDGRAYVEKYWEQTADGWKPRQYVEQV
jgi:hypothetical protein